MKNRVVFAVALSVVVVAPEALLGQANRAPSIRRQIDRQAVTQAPAVAETGEPTPPPTLSQAAKLQYLEGLVAQPPQMQAMRGAFATFREAVMARDVSFSLRTRLTPENPSTTMETVAGRADVYLQGWGISDYRAAPGGGYMTLEGGPLRVWITYLPVNTVYLAHFAVHSWDAALTATTLNCVIDFSGTSKRFDSGTTDLVLAVSVPEAQTRTCDIIVGTENQSPTEWRFWSFDLSRLD